MTILSRIQFLFATRPFDTLLIGAQEYDLIMACKDHALDPSIAGIEIDRLDVASAFEPLDYRESWNEMLSLRAQFGHLINRHVAPWYRDRGHYDLMSRFGTLR